MDNNDLIEEADAFWSACKFMLLAAAPWSIGTGVLYLLGFWSSFKINVLQYASLADLVGSTIYPILFAGAAFLVGMASGLADPNLQRVDFRKVIGEPGRLRALVSANARSFVALWAIGLFVIYAFDWQGKWGLGPAVFMIGATWVLLEQPEVRTKVLAVRFGVGALVLGLLVPPLAFSLGHTDAQEVMHGSRFLIVQPEGAVKAALAEPDVEKLRFLGHVGEFDFLYHPVKKHVIITKPAAGARLTLESNMPASRTEEEGALARFFARASNLFYDPRPGI